MKLWDFGEVAREVMKRFINKGKIMTDQTKKTEDTMRYAYESKLVIESGNMPSSLLQLPEK